MTEFDSERALAHARRMAFPRCCGSEGERRVLSYLKEMLQGCGVSFREDPFEFSEAPWGWTRVLLGCVALLFATAGLISFLSPFTALICAVIPLGLGVATRVGMHRLLLRAVKGTGCRASNLVSETLGQGPLRVYLVAHFDSKGQDIPLLIRVLCFGLVLAGGTAAAAGLGWAVFSGSVPSGWMAYASGTAAMAALVLCGQKFTNRSPGALDNASGAGALLELVRTLREHPVPGVEAVAIFTGAEEMGLMGAYAFLRRYGAEIRGTRPLPVLLNLDGVGAGEKLWVSGKASDPLVAVIRKEADLLGVSAGGPVPMIGMLADHVPFGGGRNGGGNFIGIIWEAVVHPHGAGQSRFVGAPNL
ncbi:MAG: M28 family peptidase [bacterium]|nr:M28 family peptidase [bacterium]